MPFAVPWFDNKIDPLLPSQENIKPFLYNYDEYQTYDILWHVPFNRYFYAYFHRSLKKYLPLVKLQILSDHNFAFRLNETSLLSRNDRLIYHQRASEEEALIFFDRFTPWDYPWAEDYSTKYFQFFKQYCCYISTELSSYSYLAVVNARVKDYVVGINGLVTVEDIPQFIPFEETEKLQSNFLPKFQGNPPYQLTFSCNLSTAQTIVITWLEFISSVTGGTETIKRYKILDLQSGTNTINFDFQFHVCACSMVISGDKEASVVEEIIEKVEPGLLYKNFDKLLTDIGNFFGFFPLGKHFLVGLYESQNYIPLPEWFYYASLTYANNNYWNNKINIDLSKDLGKPIYCTPIYEQNAIIDLNFNLWGNSSFHHREIYLGVQEDPLADYSSKNFGLISIENLYKKIIPTPTSGHYVAYTEEEQEALNEILEESLIQKGIALNKEATLLIIDERKKVELIEDA